MFTHRLIRGVAAGIVVVTSAGAAHAGLVNLAPGSGTGLTGITAASHPETGGVIPTGGDLIQSFQILGAGDTLLFEGALQSRVAVSNVTGTIIFFLRIRDTVAGLNGIISNVEYSGFAGWTTNVEWKDDGQGDDGPSRAERSLDGDTLNYLFGFGPLVGPDESKFFFALTDAKNYALVGTATIFLTTGESTTLTVFAPGVPSPTGAGVFALAAAATARRRRNGRLI